ncbi:MAG: hypothetical protein A2Y21_00575 [Clostridiales bacterium GWC2_40_7]|nr:MAG: hypothetical protein A2Y21_00575 [Clostridiales bacterium GWC2_40_7]
MKPEDYIKLDDRQLRRFEELYKSYKLLYEEPDNCSPKFLIITPVENLPSWEERIADPLVMLKAELDILKPHLEIGDDRIPAVRVQFGTAQVAAAFGCRMFFPENNLPCAMDHILKNARDVYNLNRPALDAGWYGKLKEWTGIWLENIPEGIHIQHPDIQSVFNTAHLIRGNDILLDFYDDPEALDALLDLVTDYMLDLVPYLKEMIGIDKEWFFDWGAMWKGSARISNCSMHMISPEMYVRHIFPRDMRFMKGIGGGRIHYCGTSGKVIEEFFKNPKITGLDFDANHHNLWEISERAPKNLVLLQWADPPEAQKSTIQRLLNGDWPKKRNIIIQVNATSVEEGRELFKKLKESIPI